MQVLTSPLCRTYRRITATQQCLMCFRLVHAYMTIVYKRCPKWFEMSQTFNRNKAFTNRFSTVLMDICLCRVFVWPQLECVAHLVQMGCEVNTVTSRFSQTPTHTAAFGGHPHCVLWLTQAGADVNRQVSVLTKGPPNPHPTGTKCPWPILIPWQR